MSSASGIASHRCCGPAGEHESRGTRAAGVKRNVRLIRGADPAWDAVLDGVRHDVYHTAAYHRHAQGSGEGEPFLLVIGDEQRGFAWPYLLRRLEPARGVDQVDGLDVHSVYGYPGPLAWGTEPGDDFLRLAWEQVLAVWQEQGAIAAFARFHPLLRNEQLVPALDLEPFANGSGGVVASGVTMSLDLTRGYESLHHYSKELRRDLRAARRAGLQTTHDVTAQHLGTFARLYEETMVRKKAGEFYFFGERNLRRLHDALPDHVQLIVATLGSEVAAAAMFLEYGGMVHWHLLGTSDRFRRLSPSKLLLDDAIRWAAERGNTVLDLGGGRGGRDDTLLWFKSRFAPNRNTFHTGRWILDQSAYRSLVGQRLAQLEHGQELDPSYFPRYRAPLRARMPADDACVEAPAIVIRELMPQDSERLGALLPFIDQTYFQPHPMTAEYARELAGRPSEDTYLIGMVGDQAVAYGMLRGWDEGFSVPSLGLGVHRSFERRGYGMKMMLALRAAAQQRGATRIRLRVNPDNVAAAALYRRLGFQEAGVDRFEILMLLDV